MAGFSQYPSGCTIQDLLGTGTDGCDLQTLDDLVGAAITTKDVSFNIATDIFLDKYKEFMMAKKLFPLIGLFGFEQNTPDSEMATSSTGIKFEIREGKVEFTIIYNKSHCFHSSVFSKKSFRKFNIILFFKNHVVGAKTIDGLTFKGFDMGMFSVGTFKVQQGTDPQQTKVMFQLTDVGTSEWNKRMLPISNEEIGTELNALEGVIDTDVTYVSAPVAGTSIVVDVKSKCNGAAKTGLTGSGKWFLEGTQGTPRTITTAAESSTVPGRYTLTLSGATVATDTVKPRLGTISAVAVEDILGNVYAGSAPVATIA